MNNEINKGSITCVGTGMTLGSHLCPLSRSHIEKADIVFTSVSHRLVEMWIEELNPNTQSLQPLYQSGKDRRQTYREMVETMMQGVRSGKKVVGAFYGHPGVFAWAPHEVIRQARKEGYTARMEPGISAEDCLYADLNIDPGAVGIAHYEASQFMFYQRRFDPSAVLVLWQVSIAGDKTMKQFSGSQRGTELLMEKLLLDYPSDHPIILYECPTLPTEQSKIITCPLSDLLTQPLSQHTTMVLPPMTKMIPDTAMLEKLNAQQE